MWAALTMAVVCLGQMKMTVSQLKQFVRSSVQEKLPDKKVAAYLKTTQLTERLEMQTVEDLIGAGAGPMTINALRAMVSASSALPKPPPDAPAAKPAPVIPPPSDADQRRIIEEAREIALNYTKGLPNYICVQVTRRYLDPSGTDFFSLHDTILTKLSYNEQREDYKVISINGQLVDTPYEKLNGAISSGEFGTMLKEIFEPQTQTEFAWTRWGKIRNHVCHVYSYQVAQSRSQWTVSWERRLNITPGYSGFIYIDRDVPQVLKVTLKADNIPTSFPIQDVSNTLDYDYTSISEQQFLLPLRSEVKMREGRLVAKNVVEFRSYRKFGAESTIKFEDTDPLPDDKVKEKPLEKK